MGDARMWRFILVTFAFLGWAFYEMSGGADYTPGPNSLQVARAEKRADEADRARRLALAPKADKRPEARPATSNGAAVVLASVKADDTVDKRVRLTLSAQPDATGRGVATVTVDPAKIIALTQPATPRAPVQIDPGAENPALAALQAALSAAPEDGGHATATTEATTTTETARLDGDIRAVEATRVNLRDGPSTDFEVITQLTRGTRVEVMHDDGAGWVELRVVDTGETGWMADYLLRAAD
jgi:hypothetical protein